MALRFRKSFKLAPGVRMNLSGSGIGWTLGPRGTSVGIGKRGTYVNSGIPGTGLSARTRLSGRSEPKRSAATDMKIRLTVEVTDAGELCFKDDQGQAVPESVIGFAKKQQADAIRELIQRKCDEINGQVEHWEKSITIPRTLATDQPLCRWHLTLNRQPNPCPSNRRISLGGSNVGQQK